MRAFYILAVGLGLYAGLTMLSARAAASDDSDENRIAILDNCDPADPAWAPTGGCLLKPGKGDVTVAEFGQLLFSPLGGLYPIGHPSWRNQPSYLTVERGEGVRIQNKGGRTHTFTQVANFGGGRVPPLNGALVQAPECLVSTVVNLAPGASANVTGLSSGLHKFQCCIHPWMRAAIRVE